MTDAIRERHNAAWDAVQDMCSGSRRWLMTVPPDEKRDHDRRIGASLNDIPDLMTRADAEKARADAETARADAAEADADRLAKALRDADHCHSFDGRCGRCGDQTACEPDPKGVIFAALAAHDKEKR